MKTNKILFTALMSVVLVGCSQDETLNLANNAPASYTGRMEEITSRVFLDQNYKMNWETGDMLTIFPKYDINNKYQVKIVADNGLATFEYVSYVEKSDYASIASTYAVYPYYDENKLEGQTITSEVPSQIEYTGTENSIKNALMSAVSDNARLTFTNAQGILRLRLDAVTPFMYGAIQSIKLESTSGQPLSGKAVIDYANPGEDGTPFAVITEGQNYLNVTLAEEYKVDLPAVGNGYAEYYIPVVPTHFAKEDLVLTITGANGIVERPVRIALDIVRKEIYTLYVTLDKAPIYEGEFEDGVDTPIIVSNLAELQAMINDPSVTEITLGGDIEGTVVMKSNKTINGNGNQLGSVNLNGAENVTLKDITFDAANAVMGYEGKGVERYLATIISRGADNKQVTGAKNLLIEGCTFTGTFPGDGGVVTSFADQGFTGSHNVTIKNCTFDVQNCGYAIYGYYFGSNLGNFVIEGNIFKKDTYANNIYLGRYASNNPVVVKNNKFEATTTWNKAFYLQAHGESYNVSYDASNNTLAE